MRGVKSENLFAIVDFLYNGEANVSQENLNSFLTIAQELKLKGLMGQTEHIDNKTERNYTNQIHQEMFPKSLHKKENSNLNEVAQHLEHRLDKHRPNVLLNNERRVSIPNFVSGEFQELDEKVKSLIEISQNLDSRGKQRAKICKLCGKEGDGTTIRDHIEANHLEGVLLLCNDCEKTFRSRMNLRRHTCAHK